MGEHILIVEDDERNQRLAAAVLGPVGGKVEVAASGGAATRPVPTEPIDFRTFSHVRSVT